MARSALVTGAGTGLGLETALYLAQHGFMVYAAILTDEQRAYVERQADTRGVQLRLLVVDVTDEASVRVAVDSMLADVGSIDAVVNNAGVSLRGYFEDLDDDEIRRTFDVNVFGAMIVTRVVLPHMRRAKQGRLVYISSIGGRVASMARTAYCASKFAIEGFAESLMQEVTPLGLTVSIVEPAIIRTERWTTNRGVARRATNPDGPYYAWFTAEERLADALVRTSPTSPGDVARAVHRALTDSRPKLRYLVGRRAGLVVVARRYVPGELFERIYFGTVMRRVTRGASTRSEDSKR